jgi:8-amino-7-oxononanoate synthase
MKSLDGFALEKLGELDRRHLRRTLVDSGREGVHVQRNGRRLVSFSCNDYLNLTQHPRVKQAAVDAIGRYGTGAGASRLVTGNHPLLGELEARLARLKGTQAACVFGSGYLANTGIIPALIGPDDLLVIDALAHACLWSGARLAGSKVITFEHNDVRHAEELLAEHRAQHPHALLATEGVFSMDGDLAPLGRLAALAQRYDAWLMVDDAHGLGVVGGGRGTNFAGNAPADIPLQMGTLSKAVGGYGGYLCASAPVIDLIRNRARTLIYSTGLPPPLVAAAIAALDIIEREPALCALPVEKARQFTRIVGLPYAQSPIVPVIVCDPGAALAASRLLEEQGYLVVAIRPPTVPPGTARLRLTFSAAHSDEDVERLATLVRTRILATVS